MRTPAIPDVGSNVDNLERCKESILHAFLQTVGIDGISKVIDIGDVLGLLRCSSHTDLGCGFEIFQNQAPAAFLFGGSSVTLIDDNQVKEIRLEKLAEMFFALIPNELLIQREIDLMRSNGTGIILGNIYLVYDLFQWSKILLDRLVYQYITVGKVKNLPFHFALEQTINNLEGCVCLAGASGHNQQQAVLPSGNSINRSVDGYSLIVAWGISVLTAVVWLLLNGFLLRRQARLQFITCNQLFLCRKFIQAKLSLFARQEVMFGKTIAIGTECERKIEHLCIIHCLLQAMGNTMVVVFRFDDGDRVIGCEVQHIVRTLWLFAHDKIALQIDLTICELCFHRDFTDIPFCRHSGSDEL